MSTEVDQRVVEMRFDNRQFEQGTKETMSTLDKLREKLHFKGAEEGFKNLSKASEKVDFNEMGSALDRIQMKFNTLDIIAMSALNHITEKAISTGEKMVKSLSVDNIASGWDKYVEKTGNVETIMNATGKSVDQVNGYLSKLMWYSDETSFSFAEMTSALSQATASGGDIGKMIPMIMGIANATADAGKSGFAFQSTIRNLMQSYSAGYLQLTDWKSLNLMGTGTKALKEELIRTAEELGTIKKGDVTIANFETTLSKKWATTDVMEKTFGNYARMMTEAYELTQQNPGMTTSDALEQLSGKYGEIAERSAKAAQQAKSFSEAISATKDAVSSKWMAVFETIIGGYDEAVDTWTELSNRLYDIFVPPIQELEDRLHGALDSGWEQFRKEFGDEADTYTAMLEKTAVVTGAITEEQITEASGFTKALKQGTVNAKLLGDTVKKTTKDARELLTLSDSELAAKGYDRAELETLRDKFDEINRKIEAGVIDLGKYSKKIGEMSGREHLIQSLWNLWDAIGKVVSPIAEAWHEIFSPANSEQIYSFAEGLDRMTAKLIISDEAAEKIKMTFKGLFSVVKTGTDTISKVVKTVTKLFDGILEAIKPLGKAVLEVAAGFGEFASEVRESLSGSGSLSDKLDGIRNSLHRLMTPLGEVKSWFRSLDIKEKLSELFYNANTLLDRLPEGTQYILRPLLGVLEQTVLGSMSLMDAVGTGLKKLVGNIQAFGKGVLEGINSTRPKLEDYGTTLKNLPNQIGASFKTFSNTFKTSFKQLSTTADDAFAPLKGFFTALKEGFDSISGTDVYRLLSLIDVGLLAYTIGQLSKATKSFSSMVGDLFKGPVTKALEGMTGSFKALSGALKSWTKTNNTKVITSIAASLLMFAGAAAILSNFVDPNRLIEIGTLLMVFAALMTAVAKILQPTEIKLASAMEGLKSRVFDSAALWGTAAVLLGLAAAIKTILEGVTNLMEVLKEGDLADSIGGMTVVITTLIACFAGLENALNSIVIGGATVMNWRSILALAAAIIAMSNAVKQIAKSVAILAEYDWSEIAVSAAAIAGIMATLYGVAWAMKKYGGEINFQNGLGFAGLSAAVLSIAGAMMILSNIPEEEFYLAAGAIGVFLTELAVIGASAKMGAKTGLALAAVAAAVSILAGSMIAIAAAIKLVGGGEIAAALGSLIVIAHLMSGKEALDFASSMLTIAGSMVVLAAAIAIYSKLDDALDGLKWCGVALMELSVAIGALSLLEKDTLQAAWSIKALAEGLLILAGAAIVFQFVDWGAMAAMVVALVAAFGALALLGLASNVVPGLAKGLKDITQAFDNFGKAIRDMALGVAILGLVSLFAGPLCEAIINAAPSIGEALTAVVTMICDVIVKCAEPIALALAALGTAAITAIVKIVYNLWEKIEPALNDIWNKFTAWVKKHNPFDPNNWSGYSKGNATKMFAFPLSDIFNELKNGDSFMASIYQMFHKSGNYAAEGTEKGIEENSDKVEKASGEMADKSVEAFNKEAGIESPSKRMAESGMYLALGLVQGIQNGTGQVVTAMQGLSTFVHTKFRNFWGIHSPSDLMEDDAQYMTEGLTQGWRDKQNQKNVLDAQDELTDKMNQHMTTAAQKWITTGVNGIQSFGRALFRETSKYNIDLSKITTTMTGALGANGLPIGLGGKTIFDMSDNYLDGILGKLQEDMAKSLPDLTNGGKSKTSSTTTQKTAAEKLADEYTKKLKSNKYLQDIADKEWSLWETKDAPDADNAAYLEKKGEALDKALDLQDKRVTIAQEQYSKMQEEASATEDQKNEALSTLLSEQKTLAELKRERYETLYEEVLDRYSGKADTADVEYDHWAAFNEKTASLTEKNDRKIKKLTDKLAIQTEASAMAKKKYSEICAELGSTSLEAEKANREWLKAETEQQEIQNELYEAQLEIYDNQISWYELESKAISTRKNLMSKLYGDGEYGTVTQTIDLTTAMQNMSYEMKRMSVASAKYDEYLHSNKAHTDDGIEALQALQEERYSFVGYMETFADALDLSDDGKRMMMQLGLAVADNWNYLRDGIGKAYNRLHGMLPEAAQSLSNLWGLFQRDGMAETITSAASVFVSIIEGDYGTALASALSFALNLANTDFGVTLTGWIGDQLSKIDWSKIPGIGAIAAGIGGLFSEGGIFAGIGGLFSEGGILAGVGTAIASLGLTVPQLGLIAAAIGTVGLAGYEVIDHWEDVQTWFKDFGDWWSNLFSNLWKGIKGFFGGIWDGVTGFFQGVGEVGANIAGGLWEGIKGGAKFVWDGVTGLGTGLIDGFKKLFGIHSPSTVMAEMGGYLGQGLANGITGTGKTVQESMNRVGSSAMRALADLDGSEYTPTIAPVVDLSDTKQKASWAQSMFAQGDGSFDAQSARTARLAAQSVKNQNGTGPAADESNAMSDAIDRLGDRMDNITEKLSRLKLVMDSGRTVGELVSGFDSSMGKRNLLAERGVI